MTAMNRADPVRVDILSVPDCPNVDATRRMVRECLAELGLTATVVEHVGRYRSPTVLVNGVDVMRPEIGAALDDASCRLDLPNQNRVLAALTASAGPNATELVALLARDRRIHNGRCADLAGRATGVQP